MRATLLRRSVIGVALGIVSCGGSSNDATHSSGGSNGIGSNGGSDALHTGGASGSTFAAGGNSAPTTGGTAASSGGASSTASPVTGGVKASGGNNSVNAGGTSAGGVATGGKWATGGTAAGGAMTGGKSATGSTTTGGAATGGESAAGGAPLGGQSATGGAAAGATGIGGTASGGNSATGGAATGGVATGGASTTSTGTTDPCSATNTLSGGTQHCNQNTSGSYGNYEWQLWSNQSKGCLTTYVGAGAAFSASWDDAGDLLARVGLVFDGTKTYQELGTFSAEFSETHTGSAGSFSYIGVYGYTVSPTFEFYIVEDSFDTLPFKPSGTSKLTSFEVDGGTYDVYSGMASGTSMTTELYSIRQTSRRCGHISISEHFSQWAAAGKVLGKLEEVRLYVEVGGGTGSIDFTVADVMVQ